MEILCPVCDSVLIAKDSDQEDKLIKKKLLLDHYLESPECIYIVPRKVIKIGNSVGITFSGKLGLKPGDWIQIQKMNIMRY